MPADTPTKRYSAITIACPWRGILPLPDGTITQGDRQTVMFMTAGLLAESPPIITETSQWRASFAIFHQRSSL